MWVQRVLRAVARACARLPVGVNRCWPGLSFLKGVLLAAIRQEVVNRNGFIVHLDPTDSLRLGMGEIHEPGLLRLIESTMRPGDLAVDVGAHIGWVSLHMARSVGPDGTAVAFEPDPANRALLERNLVANQCANVVVVPAAVWSSSGRRSLYLRDDHHGDHRLVDPGDGRSAIAVSAVTLDEYFAADERPVRMLKLDIQGAEADAVAGARRLFGRSPDLVLVLEFWPSGLRAAGSDPADLLDKLVAMGFDLALLDHPSGECSPLDATELLRRLDPKTFTGRLCRALRTHDSVDLVCRRSGGGGRRPRRPA